MTPTKTKGTDTEQIHAALADYRRQIKAKKAERARVESMPLSRDEMMQNLEAAITTASDKVRIPIENLTMPRVDGRNGPNVFVGHFDEEENPFLLLCKLAPSMVREVLTEEINQFAAAFGKGMSAEDRAAKLRAIDAEILELERKEEGLIEGAQDRGIEILRRPDVDPVAVLDIRA